MHAVLKPASANPKAARKPDPPAPTTRASYSWSMTGYLLPPPGRLVSLARRGCVETIPGRGIDDENDRYCGRNCLNVCPNPSIPCQRRECIESTKMRGLLFGRTFGAARRRSPVDIMKMDNQMNIVPKTPMERGDYNSRECVCLSILQK